MWRCFRLQRYKLLKAIHNDFKLYRYSLIVVSDYKDTNFWKQFTTTYHFGFKLFVLFQTTKIQTFESNSQPLLLAADRAAGCFRLQRYKLLKAIHNRSHIDRRQAQLFQTTKIQTFESNSQRIAPAPFLSLCCFRLQRYKLLKAIHNTHKLVVYIFWVVSDYKDTNFWKQFTTIWRNE